jgi:Ca2+-binding RTX toxin-like protein
MKFYYLFIMPIFWGISTIFFIGIFQQSIEGHEVVEGPENFKCAENQQGIIECEGDTQVHTSFVFRDEDGVLKCDRRATESPDKLSGNCIQGRGGGDTLTINDTHGHVYGDNGPDILTGGNGNDYLHGTNGNDKLDGKSGRDIMFGDQGDDTYTGGPGRDVIHCGPGNDILTDYSNDNLISYGGTLKNLEGVILTCR